MNKNKISLTLSQKNKELILELLLPTLLLIILIIIVLNSSSGSSNLLNIIETILNKFFDFIIPSVYAEEIEFI
jgi:predicted ATP-binding protein involved in virulence